MYDKGREKTENTVGERSVMRETMTEVKSKGVYLFWVAFGQFGLPLNSAEWLNSFNWMVAKHKFRTRQNLARVVAKQRTAFKLLFQFNVVIKRSTHCKIKSSKACSNCNCIRLRIN